MAGPIIRFGTYWFAHEYFDFGQPLGESYAVFALPGILGLILLANTVFLGLASDELSDAALEWWSRFAAWLDGDRWGGDPGAVLAWLLTLEPEFEGVRIASTVDVAASSAISVTWTSSVPSTARPSSQPADQRHEAGKPRPT